MMQHVVICGATCVCEDEQACKQVTEFSMQLYFLSIFLQQIQGPNRHVNLLCVRRMVYAWYI